MLYGEWLSPWCWKAAPLPPHRPLFYSEVTHQSAAKLHLSCYNCRLFFIPKLCSHFSHSLLHWISCPADVEDKYGVDWEVRLPIKPQFSSTTALNSCLETRTTFYKEKLLHCMYSWTLQPSCSKTKIRQTIQFLLEWTEKENKSLEVVNLFKVPFVTFLFYEVCAQVKAQSTNSELVWEVKVVPTSLGVFAEVNTQRKIRRTVTDWLGFCSTYRDSSSLLKQSEQKYRHRYPCRDSAPQDSASIDSIIPLNSSSARASPPQPAREKLLGRQPDLLGLSFPAGSFMFHALKYPMLRHCVKVSLQTKHKGTGAALTHFISQIFKSLCFEVYGISAPSRFLN